MRPDCERCGTDLPAEPAGAVICSFECTFCAECAEALDDRCPNCGGGLAGRGRLVIRPSGTEPVIRAMAEADDAAEVTQVVDRVCDAVRKAA